MSLSSIIFALPITDCAAIFNAMSFFIPFLTPALASASININMELEEYDTVLVSIAAGKTIGFIRDNLSHDNKIVRIMPNINAKVAAACSAYCTSDKVADEEKKEIEF